MKVISLYLVTTRQAIHDVPRDEPSTGDYYQNEKIGHFVALGTRSYTTDMSL